MYVRNKRINGYGRATFDLYKIEIMPTTGYRNERFLATIEINGEAPGGIKVLYGALQPKGKERAWEAIRAYEFPK